MQQALLQDKAAGQAASLALQEDPSIICSAETDEAAFPRFGDDPLLTTRGRRKFLLLNSFFNRDSGASDGISNVSIICFK